MRITHRKGFTLIELLVVVAIISILVSVIISSLNDARAAARDSVRLQEMKEIQKALELYREEHGEYPQTGGPDPATNCMGITSFNTALQPLVDGGYLSMVPGDPLGPLPPSNPRSLQLCYYYSVNSASLCNNEDGHDYVLSFSTERSDPYNLDEGSVFSDYCLTPQ